jgi:hypothetical protein
MPQNLGWKLAMTNMVLKFCFPKKYIILAVIKDKACCIKFRVGMLIKEMARVAITINRLPLRA